jgi:hypothetical protein
MSKNILTVVGITLLFLGLAIQPSIATVQPEKIDVEPDVEGLVAQLGLLLMSYYKIMGIYRLLEV